MEKIYEVQNALNIQLGVVLEESASELTQGWKGNSMTEQANAHYYPR